MTVYFNDSLNKLNNRLRTLDRAFERHLIYGHPKKAVDKWAIQEGLMSSLWQSWCQFCRDIILGSVTGGQTTGGAYVSSPNYSTLSERQLVYVAQRFSNNQNITQVKSAASHIELTWGDVIKLNPVITSFNPSNCNTLVSSLGGATLLTDLQKFRNANAHITSHTLGEIKIARTRYSGTKFRHPSDTMFWIDNSTNDYLWKSWIEEIEIVSSLMTS